MPARCVFCGAFLRDEAEGFMDHLKGRADCHLRWVVWTEFLHEDWGGE